MLSTNLHKTTGRARGKIRRKKGAHWRTGAAGRGECKEKKRKAKGPRSSKVPLKKLNHSIKDLAMDGGGGRRRGTG